MFYHGTNVGGLKELRPKSSNQGKYVIFLKIDFRFFHI